MRIKIIFWFLPLMLFSLALPKELPSGTIEGVLLRGNMEIKKVKWKGAKVEMELYSGSDLEYVLQLPSEINSISCKGTIVKSDNNPLTRIINIKGGTTALINIVLTNDFNQ